MEFNDCPFVSALKDVCLNKARADECHTMEFEKGEEIQSFKGYTFEGGASGFELTTSKQTGIIGGIAGASPESIYEMKTETRKDKDGNEVEVVVEKIIGFRFDTEDLTHKTDKEKNEHYMFFQAMVHLPGTDFKEDLAGAVIIASKVQTDSSADQAAPASSGPIVIKSPKASAPKAKSVAKVTKAASKSVGSDATVGTVQQLGAINIALPIDAAATEGGGLGLGALIGICVGALVCIGVIVGVVCFMMMKKKGGQVE